LANAWNEQIVKITPKSRSLTTWAIDPVESTAPNVIVQMPRATDLTNLSVGLLLWSCSIPPDMMSSAPLRPLHTHIKCIVFGLIGHIWPSKMCIVFGLIGHICPLKTII
jgi:hypothetical protein